MKNIKNFLIILFVVLFYSCKNDKAVLEYSSFKLDNNIAEISPPIQKFKINPNSDTIIFTSNGSYIYIESSIFKNNSEEVVSDSIDIEIIEAIDLSDILRLNLSTMSKDGILESDGMIYINAFKNGNQLSIIENKSLKVFLKNENLKDGMSVWFGTDSQNQLLWENVDSLDKELISVDLNSLDFSLEASMPEFVVRKIGDVPENLNSSLSEKEAVEIGLITRDTTFRPQNYEVLEMATDLDEMENDSAGPCGINKEYVNLIKDEKFQNTLISTKEFEHRMKFIHRTCDVEVLKIYINNLGLNLWEVDELAYNYLLKTDNVLAINFKKFSNQKLTKVKDANPDNKNFIETINSINTMIKSKKEQQQIAGLFYQFSARNFGWYNIDKYWKRKDLSPVKVEVNIPEIDNVKKIQLSLSIPIDKVVIPLSENENGKWTINPPNFIIKAKLPIGAKALLTGVIQDSNNNFFLINQEFTIENENYIDAIINKKSNKEIIKELKLKSPKKRKLENEIYDCCNSNWNRRNYYY